MYKGIHFLNDKSHKKEMLLLVKREKTLTN